MQLKRPLLYGVWFLTVILYVGFTGPGHCQSAPLHLAVGKTMVIPVQDYRNHALGPESEGIIGAKRADGGVQITALREGKATLHVFDTDLNRTEYHIEVVAASSTEGAKPVVAAPETKTGTAALSAEAEPRSVEKTPPTAAPAETADRAPAPAVAPVRATPLPPRVRPRRLTSAERKSQAEALEERLGMAGVSVEAANGVVKLTGTVSTETERVRAQRLAELLTTGRVVNDLKVSPLAGARAHPGQRTLTVPVAPGEAAIGVTPQLTPQLTTVAEGDRAPLVQLTIPSGRSEILSTTENIMKVIVADGEVVSAEVISARQVLLIGLGPGHTDAYLVVEQYPDDPLGAVQHYEVTVPEPPADESAHPEPQEPALNPDELRFMIEDNLADLPDVTVTVLVPLWKPAPKAQGMMIVNPKLMDEPAPAEEAATATTGRQEPVLTGGEPFVVILRGVAPTAEDVQRAGEIAGALGGLVLNYIKAADALDALPEPTTEELRQQEALRIGELLKKYLGIDTITPLVTEKGVVLLGTAPSQRVADQATQLVDNLADWEAIRPLAPMLGSGGSSAGGGGGGGDEMLVVNPNVEGYGRGGGRGGGGGSGGGGGGAAQKNLQAFGVANLLEVVGRVQQITTQARIVEIDRNALAKLGVEWGTTDQTAGITGGTTTGISAPRVGAVAFGETAGVGTSITRLTSLITTLEMLEDNGKAHTLSKPDLLAIEGTRADLIVGGQIPIPATTFAGGGGGGGGGGGAGNQGGFATQTVEFRPYGILLSVLPEATEGGHVLMQLRVESSTLDYSNAINITGIAVPAFKTRQVQDALWVKDGDTIVIAGLISQDEQQQVQKIPFLSEIPILGELFKKKTFQSGETELVIFLTPHVSEDSASAETMEYADKMRKFEELAAPDFEDTFGGASGTSGGGQR